LGRAEESAVDLKCYVALDPNTRLGIWGHAVLADDYAVLGHEDAVRREAAEVERILALAPDFSSCADCWPSIPYSLAITRHAEGIKPKRLRL
jgi:hypothetical protein